MAKDWVGNKRSTAAALGASNRSERDREENDFYATPPVATERLLAKLKEVGIELPKKITEPAVGMGHIAKVLKDHGYDIEAADVVDRKWKGTKIQNFLDATSIEGNAIITNPPYKYGAQFAVHANELLNDGEYCCMLLKIQFLEGKERADILYKAGLQPKYVFVFPDRINCAKQGRFKEHNELFEEATKGEDLSQYGEAESDSGGQIAYMWAVWQKGFKGMTQLGWL